jgi:hypothetical protein
MPGRLRAALALLGLLVLLLGWTILAFGPNFLNTCSLGVVAAILFRLPYGHPLTRQLAFYVAALLLFAGAALAPSAIFVPARVVPGLALLGSGALLAWCLSGPGVLRYFNLHCIACDSYVTYQRGFLYQHIGCRKCRREWKPGELLDPSIFE